MSQHLNGKTLKKKNNKALLPLHSDMKVSDFAKQKLRYCYLSLNSSYDVKGFDIALFLCLQTLTSDGEMDCKCRIYSFMR